MGGVSHVLTVVRDVTEQRRTVAALRRSEAMLRGILDNLQDAYVRADPDGRVVMVSPSTVRLYGYDSADDMVGLDASDLYAVAGTRDAILEHLREHGHVVDLVARALRKDGSTFWASLNAQFCYDGDGEVAGTEGFVRDISEHINPRRSCARARRSSSISSSTRSSVSRSPLPREGCASTTPWPRCSDTLAASSSSFACWTSPTPMTWT